MAWSLKWQSCLLRCCFFLPFPQNPHLTDIAYCCSTVTRQNPHLGSLPLTLSKWLARDDHDSTVVFYTPTMFASDLQRLKHGQNVAFLQHKNFSPLNLMLWKYRDQSLLLFPFRSNKVLSEDVFSLLSQSQGALCASSVKDPFCVMFFITRRRFLRHELCISK